MSVLDYIEAVVLIIVGLSFLPATISQVYYYVVSGALFVKSFFPKETTISKPAKKKAKTPAKKKASAKRETKVDNTQSKRKRRTKAELLAERLGKEQ